MPANLEKSAVATGLEKVSFHSYPKEISILEGFHFFGGTFLVIQMVKHLSTMQETWVRSLSWEDSLEKEMATHSGTLA